MHIQSIKQAGWIARFIHILILAAIVAPGVFSGSRALIAILTAVWFLLFSAVYLFARPPRP